MRCFVNASACSMRVKARQRVCEPSKMSKSFGTDSSTRRITTMCSPSSGCGKR